MKRETEGEKEREGKKEEKREGEVRKERERRIRGPVAERRTGKKEAVESEGER